VYLLNLNKSGNLKNNVLGKWMAGYIKFNKYKNLQMSMILLFFDVFNCR